MLYFNKNLFYKNGEAEIDPDVKIRSHQRTQPETKY